MYDYERQHQTKTAAKMDLHGEWSDIVERHRSEESKAMFRLLQKTTDYLGSVGFDLDIDKSFLDKELRASDGPRMSGHLRITEREENTTSSPDARSAEKWVQSALGVHGSAHLVKEGPEKNRMGQPIKTWVVDLGE